MVLNIKKLIQENQGKQHSLHTQFLNAQLVKMLKTIGFDRDYVRGEGPYLFDAEGNKYLDLLGGYGVFGMGRSHPTVIQAIKDVLDLKTPNLVKMDADLLAGILAKNLVAKMPDGLDTCWFCNSGAEAVEAAIKFAKCATKREKIVFCDHAFHGLTNGALSLNGSADFRDGFEPLLPGCVKIPFDDLQALERALQNKDVACFIVEPIQGKTVSTPSDNYLPAAQKLCQKYGTLFMVDEIQTGLGRSGKFLALEHWNLQPDIVTIAKILSGGFIPIGAMVAKKWIFEKVYNRLDRAVVHSSTYAKNDLACAAGIASLHVIEEEKLVEKAARNGAVLREGFEKLIGKYEFVKAVHGKGMMLGIEFGPPKSLKLKAAWKLLEKANKGLFCQMITIPLMKEHRILSQVAGHHSYTIKLLPPLAISSEDIHWILTAFDQVIAEAHHFPGAIWSLATSLAGNALSNKKEVQVTA